MREPNFLPCLAKPVSSTANFADFFIIITTFPNLTALSIGFTNALYLQTLLLVSPAFFL